MLNSVAQCMSRKCLGVFGIALFVSTITQPNHANECMVALQKIIDCKSIGTDIDRLSCFDAQLERWPSAAGDVESCELTQETMVGQALGRDDANSTAPAEPQTQELPVEAAFGNQVREERARSAQSRSITLTLEQVGTTSAGNPYFVFVNGQRWQQLASDSRRILQPEKFIGKEFTIRRGLFSSHTLSPVGSRRAVKVKRLR